MEDTRQREIIHDNIAGYASSHDILGTDLYWKTCSGRCRSDVKSTTRTSTDDGAAREVLSIFATLLCAENRRRL